MSQIESGDIDRRARKLLEDSVVVEGTSFFCHGYNERLRKAGVTVLQTTVPWDQDTTRNAIQRAGEYYKIIAADNKLSQILNVQDIYECHREGKVGILFASQDGSILEDDVNNVEMFWRLGFRVIQLTYSHQNLLGSGCMLNEDLGLTNLGKDMIRAFNRTGMVLDLSHVGEKTALAAMDVAEKPFIYSHSNPIKRAPFNRNITDEQIRLCAKKGGTIGLCPFPLMTWTGGDKEPDIEDYINHVEYVAELVGIDHVAFGSDSEATPGGYPPELIKRLLDEAEFPETDYAKKFPGKFGTYGYESMENIPNVVEKLQARSWRDEDIAKFLGENIIRVYQSNWQ